MRQTQIILNLSEGKLVLCQTFVEIWHFYLNFHILSSVAPWWYSSASLYVICFPNKWNMFKHCDRVIPNLFHVLNTPFSACRMDTFNVTTPIFDRSYYRYLALDSQVCGIISLLLTMSNLSSRLQRQENQQIIYNLGTFSM